MRRFLGAVAVAGITFLFLPFAPAAYAAAGDLDPTFGVGGRILIDCTTSKQDNPWAMAWQADGKMVAAGQSGGSNEKFALARYDTDGSLDTTFGGDGKVTTDFTSKYDAAYGVAIQADGKIVAAGLSGCCGPPQGAGPRSIPRRLSAVKR